MTLHSSRARLFMLVAASCAFSVTAAFAQSPSHSRSARTRFNEMDVNHDGLISRSEWRGTSRDFRAHDRNADGVLSWREVQPSSRSEYPQDDRAPQDTRARESRATDATQGRPTSRAFEGGRQRGLEEGRRAGQEDRARGRWDLDGQQELEGADSGYRQDLGSREEYQAGYREAFITAYREAFGSRAPRHGAAYREGQTRGMADGREAGREDASRSHWDLEGQQELLLADAGYRPELGSRSEYEEGYRAGFRQGYSDGFGRR